MNYQPSVLGPMTENSAVKYSELPLQGTTQQARIHKTLNFRQAGEFYRSLGKTEQKNLISNLAGDLKAVKNEQILHTLLSHFYKADADYGRALSAAVGVNAQTIAALAARLSE